MIGYKIWDFSTEAIELGGGELAFSHRWETKKYGDWELKGRIYANMESDTTNALKCCKGIVSRAYHCEL